MKENKYASDALYNTVGNIAYYFCLWLITVLIVRLSGYEDAGILSVAMTTTNIFFVIGNYGMRSFQSSDINNEYSHSQYVTSRYISVALAFLFCVLFCIIGNYDRLHTLAIIIFMLFKCIEAFSDVLYGVWQAHSYLRFAGISLCIKGAANLSIFIVLMLFTKNLIFSLCGMVIVSLAILLTYDIPKTLSISSNVFALTSDNFEKSIKLLQHTFFMFVVSICPMILQAIPKLMFEKLYTTSELGIYSSISSPTTIIPTFVSCIMIPFLPLFAKYIDSQDCKKLFRLFICFYMGVIFIGIIACVFASLIGDWALYILFGEDLSEYISLLIGIIISVILICLLYCYNALFIAGRKLVSLAITYLASDLLCFILSYFFVNRYGLMGIVYTLIFSQIAQCVLLTFMSIPFFTVHKKSN